MKSNNDSKLSCLSAPWLGWLRTGAIAIILFGLSIGPGAARPAPGEPNAHVYLVRGVLNIFSLGMDEIAAKLQQQGIDSHRPQSHVMGVDRERCGG